MPELNNQAVMPVISDNYENKTDRAAGQNGEMANRKAVWTSLILALYLVAFVWNFWDKGVVALGLNFSAVLSGVLYLLYLAYPERKMLERRNLWWLLPVFAIAASFGIYDNPFIKAVNLLAFPAAILVFYNQSQIRDAAERIWGFRLILDLAARMIAIFGSVGDSIQAYVGMIRFKDPGSETRTRKIVIGIALFLALALLVVVPLLSSADQEFNRYFSVFYDWLGRFISATYVAKALMFIIWSIALLSMALAWNQRYAVKHQEPASSADSIISGIVLGGTLALYLLFLFVQLKYLWVKSLPIDFRTAETLVKSGFWQLFMLSLLNIVLFFFTFRKTSAVVQKILSVFTAASLLLLISAGYRMYLYVVNYGFSYEKFYASYVVIYCALLFLWLLSRFFVRTKNDVVGFLAFLLLWMYALVAIFPVEQFIMRTNIVLAQRPETRIDLGEMRMLSGDVLGLVKSKVNTDLARNQHCIKDEEKNTCKPIDWTKWLEERENAAKDKKVYERNLMDGLRR